MDNTNGVVSVLRWHGGIWNKKLVEIIASKGIISATTEIAFAGIAIECENRIYIWDKK